MAPHFRISIGRVYCKYHYLEYKSFSSSEHELMHFLKLFNNPKWEWLEQYGVDELLDEDDENRTFGRAGTVCVAADWL